MKLDSRFLVRVFFSQLHNNFQSGNNAIIHTYKEMWNAIQPKLLQKVPKKKYHVIDFIQINASSLFPDS